MFINVKDLHHKESGWSGIVQATRHLCKNTCQTPSTCLCGPGQPSSVVHREVRFHPSLPCKKLKQHELPMLDYIPTQRHLAAPVVPAGCITGNLIFESAKEPRIFKFAQIAKQTPCCHWKQKAHAIRLSCSACTKEGRQPSRSLAAFTRGPHFSAAPASSAPSLAHDVPACQVNRGAEPNHCLSRPAFFARHLHTPHASSSKPTSNMCLKSCSPTLLAVSRNSLR